MCTWELSLLSEPEPLSLSSLSTSDGFESCASMLGLVQLSWNRFAITVLETWLERWVMLRCPCFCSWLLIFIYYNTHLTKGTVTWDDSRCFHFHCYALQSTVHPKRHHASQVVTIQQMTLFGPILGKKPSSICLMWLRMSRPDWDMYSAPKNHSSVLDVFVGLHVSSEPWHL